MELSHHSKRILVTGATGFIGRFLCAKLIAKNFLVKALVKNDGGYLSPDVELEVIPGLEFDLDWSKILADVDSVVHLAARVHQMNEHPDDNGLYSQINFLATKRLAEECLKHKIRKFIFLSTVKVMGEHNEFDPLTSKALPFIEGMTPHPVGAYAQSKWQSEQFLQELSSKNPSLQIIVLRPPLVYGPTVTANFLQLLKLVKLKAPLPLKKINNKRSFIYVENLVDAIIHCLKYNSRTQFSTYFVSDGLDISTPELIRKLAGAIGNKPILFNLPPALLTALLSIIGKRQIVERLTTSLQVDTNKISKELAWQPPYSVDIGIKNTVDWYLSQAK